MRKASFIKPIKLGPRSSSQGYTVVDAGNPSNANAVLPQLIPSVQKLASVQDIPSSDLSRRITDRKAADVIADYEQRQVVQQGIYDGHPMLQGVMWANQKLSETTMGRGMGATPPEVAFSADCNSTDRVPLNGSINDPSARVIYYQSLMQHFNAGQKGSSELVDTLSKEPAF